MSLDLMSAWSRDFGSDGVFAELGPFGGEDDDNDDLFICDVTCTPVVEFVLRIDMQSRTVTDGEICTVRGGFGEGEYSRNPIEWLPHATKARPVTGSNVIAFRGPKSDQPHR
jgi:hypothetical protein